jgi:hypothetical protein
MNIGSMARVHVPIRETQEQDEAEAAELGRSRGLTSLKYSLPKDHFGREMKRDLWRLWTVIASTNTQLK